jgi:hypothetical protein
LQQKVLKKGDEVESELGSDAQFSLKMGGRGFEKPDLAIEWSNTGFIQRKPS